MSEASRLGDISRCSRQGTEVMTGTSMRRLVLRGSISPSVPHFMVWNEGGRVKIDLFSNYFGRLPWPMYANSIELLSLLLTHKFGIFFH